MRCLTKKGFASTAYRRTGAIEDEGDLECDDCRRSSDLKTKVVTRPKPKDVEPRRWCSLLEEQTYSLLHEISMSLSYDLSSNNFPNSCLQKICDCCNLIIVFARNHR